MIITILWEDQRAARATGFGPHELLLACAADDLGCAPFALQRRVVGSPKKGNSNVIRALQHDLAGLKGPACAVLDRDRILAYWQVAAERPAACLTGIKGGIAAKAPGDYKLVLLDQNVETLIDACCDAIARPRPSAKPSTR